MRLVGAWGGGEAGEGSSRTEHRRWVEVPVDSGQARPGWELLGFGGYISILGPGLGARPRQLPASPTSPPCSPTASSTGEGKACAPESPAQSQSPRR